MTNRFITATSNRTLAIPVGLRVPLVAFVSSRIVVWIAMYIPTLTGFSLYSNPEARFSTFDLLNVWVRWDAGWYLRIVENGYWFSVTEESSIAFFPVYPMLIRALTPLVGEPILAGLIISHVCFFLSLIVLYQLVIQVLSIEHMDTAKRTVYYMAWFPASFVFSSVLTESVFLLATVSTAYFAYQKKWVIAALCGAIASATRATGIFMLLVLGIEWLNHVGWSLVVLVRWQTWKAILSKLAQDWRIVVTWLLVPTGILIFMLFNYLEFADPIAFRHAQSGFGWEVTNPLQTLLVEINIMLSGQLQLHRLPYFSLIEIIALLIVAFMLPAIIRLRESWAVYCGLSIYVSSSLLIHGSLRFVIMLFPVFIAFAKMNRHPSLHRLTITLFATFLALFTFLNANWIYIG